MLGFLIIGLAALFVILRSRRAKRDRETLGGIAAKLRSPLFGGGAIPLAGIAAPFARAEDNAEPLGAGRLNISGISGNGGVGHPARGVF